MKNFLILFLTTCSLICCSQKTPREVVEYPYPDEKLEIKDIFEVAKDEITETLSDLKLNGKIKKVEINTYFTDELNIDISQYQLTKSMKGFEDIPVEYSFNLEMTFNKQGKLIKSIGIDEIPGEFTVYNIQKNEYNENEDVIRKMVVEYRKTEENDSIFIKNDNYEYAYDDIGHLKKEKIHYLLGTIKDSITESYEYFKDTNQIKITRFKDNEIFYSGIETYNKYGLTILDQELLNDSIKGSLNAYEYDEYGEVIKEYFQPEGEDYEEYKRYVDPNEEIHIYRLFDHHGNCIERYFVTYDKSMGFKKIKKIVVTKQKFQYY